VRTSAGPLIEDDAVHVDWSIVLAGDGDASRLSDYVERRIGRRIPRPYCRVFGEPTLLERTLDRLNRLAPPSRTIGVIAEPHATLAWPQLAGRCDHVVRQPSTGDSGVALFVALAIIRRSTPNALVTISPADHQVSPGDAYVAQVRIARGIAARMRDTVVVLGVRPSEPDLDHSYLAVGEPVAGQGRVRRIDACIDQPSRPLARMLGWSGALWNTTVTCATVDALWELGRETQPQLLAVLDSLVPLIGTPDEADAMDYVFRSYLPVSFTHDVLERGPHHAVALELEDVVWIGPPERGDRHASRELVAAFEPVTPASSSPRLRWRRPERVPRRRL